MIKFSEHIETIGNFKTDYSKSLSDKQTRFRGLCIRALEVFRTGSRPDLIYETYFRPHVDRLMDISEIFNNKEIFGYVYANNLTFLPITKIDASKITDDMEFAYNELHECLKDIEAFVIEKEQIILDNINKSYNEMTNCPYGTKERRKRNANDFERCAVELFSWLFVGEVALIEPGKSDEHYSIVKRKLQRDAMYEVYKSINVDPVLKDYNFLHFIVECKNFEKPTYTALLQAYAYMIFERMLLHADNKTLCIILSRENPDDCDIVIRMRDRLCEVNRNLMMIFMSVDDIGKMINERLKNKKPSKIIYDCIRTAKRQSKTGEYY